jgi:hypothetical protein
MKVIVFGLLATFASSVFAAECKISASPFFKAASDITIKISKDGKSQKVTLDSMLQREGETEFGAMTVAHVDVKTIALFKISMYFKEASVWEKVDKVVAADQYKPYYIPSVRVEVHVNAVQPNGFSSESGTGDSASIPAKVGSSKDIGGYRFEVAEINDRELLVGGCGKRFEASPAEVFCFEQKYTHNCVEQYHPVEAPPK